MNELDPGMLTLIASCVGAILFFCAGVFWNDRPGGAMDGHEPSGGLDFSSANPSKLGGASGRASYRGPDWDPAKGPMSLLGSGSAGGFGEPIPRRPGRGAGRSAGRTRSRSRVTPPYVLATPSSQGARAPTSLRSYLEELTQQLDASSTLLLDESGLLFTEGRDAHGVGARLCALLDQAVPLSEENERFREALAFQLGELRLQRLPDDEGPEGWLATVGAKRFASEEELKASGRALGAELGVDVS